MMKIDVIDTTLYGNGNIKVYLNCINITYLHVLVIQAGD